MRAKRWPAGVTKTYRLTYEPVEVMHALFDKNAAGNIWTVSSRLLKDFTYYFGPKTEQLDIYSEEDRVTFTSYTEKVLDGKEILKQPLQTSVSIDTQNFDVFKVENQLHIAISVKDFKAIVAHADLMKTSLTARYSQPTRPMQFSYETDGILCEFTLMTIGDFRNTSNLSSARAPTTRTQHASRATSNPSMQSSRSAQASMPPPDLPASGPSSRLRRRLGKATPGAMARGRTDESQDLFVAAGDDDRRWDPAEYREDEEEMLGWDASTDNDLPLRPSFQDSGVGPKSRSREVDRDLQQEGIEPTQRAAEIRGLFDD